MTVPTQWNPSIRLCSKQLDTIADNINTRPRATLNCHTPLKVLAQALTNSTDRFPYSNSCRVASRT